MTNIKTAIGCMSGTSMDGIDLALLRTDGIDFIETIKSAEFPFAATDRQAIERALHDASEISAPEQRPGDTNAVGDLIVKRHAEAINQFLMSMRIDHAEIDVIGFHGQTVLHRPDQGLTVQLGDGAALSKALGIPIVWDMRANDMSNGGQGAPLVPVYHRALAAKLNAKQTIAFVNIGGISNVTFVMPGRDPIAFDCGPGNALIDQWVQANTNANFDEDGALGLAGTEDGDLVASMLDHPFFKQAGPKSLDRNDFKLPPMDQKSARDGAATLAAFTAKAIALSEETAGLKPHSWVISGGGARNGAIVNELQAILADARVETADDVGLNSNMMEAECWAYLAVRSMRGFPLTFPSTTGCAHACTGGILSLPD